MISKQTADFLLGLLNTQQLNVGAPDFDEVVGRVIQARAELSAVLADEAIGEHGSADDTGATA